MRAVGGTSCCSEKKKILSVLGSASHTGSESVAVIFRLPFPPSIPCYNSRTPGAGDPTKVPHSQPDPAGCAPVLAPSCQPQLPHRPLHHGVPSWGALGDAR